MAGYAVAFALGLAVGLAVGHAQKRVRDVFRPQRVSQYTSDSPAQVAAGGCRAALIAALLLVAAGVLAWAWVAAK